MEMPAKHSLVVYLGRIIILCFVTIQFLSGETIRQTLNNALQKTKKTSFVCDFIDKDILAELGADTGKYSQWYAEDGFEYKKLIFFDKNHKQLCQFVKNRNGSFAQIEGKTGKIAEIIYLSYFDDISEGICQYEEDFSTYSIRTTLLHGKTFYVIQIKTIQDALKISLSNPEFPLPYNGTDDIKSDFYAKRPMYRLFFIGKEDGLLYFREHYNRQKHTIYDRKITNPVFSPKLSETDFTTNGKIQGDYLFLMDEFLEPYLYKVAANRLKLNKDTTYYHNSIVIQCIDWILEPRHSAMISYVLAALAIILSISLFLVKWKKRKQPVR